jgi:hypothetical protein
MSVIPQTPRVSRGLCPLGPLPGLCIGPAGDLKRSPDTLPTHAPPPLTTNPGSAPGHDDNVCFALYQHAELYFYNASSLKQQSLRRHVAPLRYIVLISSQLVLALTF